MSEPSAPAGPASKSQDPAPGQPGAALRLFVVSLQVLFAELLLLRLDPANITYIGFFSNFLLVGCFLGIGVGILAGARLERFRVSPLPVLLLLVVLLVTKAQLNVQVRQSDEIFFGLSESRAADVNYLVLPLAVALTTFVLAAAALPLGPLLRAMPPLRAYAVDIAGALAGIALFTALSALGTSPLVWFAVLGALGVTSAFLRGARAGLVLEALGAAAVVGVLVTTPTAGEEKWSPYYRVNHGLEAVTGTRFVHVNGIPHQVMLPLSRLDPPGKRTLYNQVHSWLPERKFERVLVVGAGNGNDVAVALARGAKHVDAVEIDPVIAGLGKAHHPEHPYADDKRVTLHVTDGRNFIRTTRERYDLVIFALPDSLTLVTSNANLRLESFLFTRESFADVKERLSPDGVFVLYNYYRLPWLIDKIADMLTSVFGRPPLLGLDALRQGAVLATGPGVPSGHPATRIPDRDALSLEPATDDWPFLYLRAPGVPGHYLVGLGVVFAFAVVLALVALQVAGTSPSRASPHFFVLGIAFMLIETRSLVTMSLLFGSTWLVNALSFFAILTSVLAAILVSSRAKRLPPALLYVGLFASLAVGVFLRPESLLFEPAWLRYAVASAVTFAPIFCANLVFTHSFRDTATADTAFASNLLGATVGGAVEYAALSTGYRALLVVAAGLYALAWLLGTRVRLFGDRELTPGKT